MRLRRLLVASVVACAAVDAPAPAMAQPKAELARAREQFRQGLALEAAGNWTRALEVFKGVAEIKSTAQVRYHIALCEEKTGDWVQAIGSYRMALLEAEQAKVKDVIESARHGLETLQPKIPKLTVTRGDGAAVAEIKLDGKPLGATLIGTAMQLNPGPHVVEATSPDRKPFRVELDLGEGAAQSVEVVLGASAAPEVSDTPATPSTPAAADEDGVSPLLPAGIVVGVLGLASLGVAGAFYGLRAGNISDLEDQCGPEGKSCPPSARDVVDEGERNSTIATATFFGGLGAVVLGVVLVIAAPKGDAEPAAALRVVPTGGPRAAGVSLHGRF